MELCGVAEVEEHHGVGAVSMRLCGEAEAEECHGAWAAEAKEPCRSCEHGASWGRGHRSGGVVLGGGHGSDCR